MKTLFCTKPDRHSPKMECGYPLPCPHHTVVIEKGKTTVPHALGASKKTRGRIKQIAEVFKK